jgi:hypothetical protein
LVVDIKKRISAEEARKHPFIMMHSKTQTIPQPPPNRTVTQKIPQNNTPRGTEEDVSCSKSLKEPRTGIVTSSIETVYQKPVDKVVTEKQQERTSIPVILPNVHSQVREVKKQTFTARVNRLASWLRGSALTNDRPKRS